MPKQVLHGGPDFDTCLAELHYRLEEFKRAYVQLSARYPERFPMRPLIQKRINVLFARFLSDSKITESPVEGSLASLDAD